MEFVYRTDVGKCRTENQDSACVFAHAGFLIGIVADGMGGHNGGAAASGTAVADVKAYLTVNLRADADEVEAIRILQEAYMQTNQRIYAQAQSETMLAGMGTTMTVVLLRERRMLIANIGDSRAYIINKEQIRQLTVDQTLVQRLIDSGEISIEEARKHPHRHIILEAVGTTETIEPEIYTADLQGETVLICSDGLTGEAEDKQIHEIVCTAEDLAQAADELIRLANACGGEDNITVALLRA